MLNTVASLILSGIIQMNGIAILPPLVPNIIQKPPSKELQKEVTEAELREEVIKYGLIGDHQNMCIALDALGEFCDSIERYSQAEFCYLGALKSIKTHFGANSIEAAFAYSRLSGHYVIAHDYSAALRANSKALKIMCSVKKPDAFKLAIMHHNQAWLEAGYSYFRSAEQHYIRSIQIFRDTVGPNHLMVGLSQNNLAKVYLVQHKYAEAEQSFAEAFRILAAQPVADKTFRTLLQNYAEVLHKLGKHVKAEELLDRLKELNR